MFREMRRKKQALSPEECSEILARGSSGVLAVAGDNGYPYAVPLSYVWQDGRLLFHCAVSGHKLDAIDREPRVSFCVIDRDQVIPESYTTWFRSVIVFGRARVLTDPAERRTALMCLAAKYSPHHLTGAPAEIDGSFDRVCLVVITPDHLSGKAALELVDSGQNTAGSV